MRRRDHLSLGYLTSSVERYLHDSKGGCLPIQVDNKSMDRTPTTVQKFVAEMLGTSFLTWIGAGSITAAVFLLNGAKPPLAHRSTQVNADAAGLGTRNNPDCATDSHEPRSC